VLSAMLSLSSISEGREDAVPLRDLVGGGIEILWDERRANGGGGGFFDCDACSEASGLGIISRSSSLVTGALT
jgi:hypothetical protein